MEIESLTLYSQEPWEVAFEKRDGRIIYRLKNTNGFEGGEEAEANARLMEKAPDLLNALKNAVSHGGLPKDEESLRKIKELIGATEPAAL